MTTSALLGPGLHTLVSYVCVHMCVQTHVYTGVFLGAGHATSGWQNRGWGHHLKPGDENDV